MDEVEQRQGERPRGNVRRLPRRSFRERIDERMLIDFLRVALVILGVAEQLAYTS
jgi:hypothetical protein